MLRPPCRAARRASRRPRTRGDAPIGLELSRQDLKSTPHPRGCSLPSGAGLRRADVDPAPAGMLRPCVGCGAASVGRPRTRGDAPLLPPGCPALYQSTPHPRGCSGACPLLPRQVRVDPAPAGMLPARASTAEASPCRHPAPAGMLRLRPPAPRRLGRRPRARGDASRGGVHGDAEVSSTPPAGPVRRWVAAKAAAATFAGVGWSGVLSRHRFFLPPQRDAGLELVRRGVGPRASPCAPGFSASSGSRKCRDARWLARKREWTGGGGVPAASG
ncbi:hypothetical protein SAMN05421870_105186 [Streptomyces qinglanensis]|uniref:Uncharacterized protein n=1 Tax=Streptomyces qinglanensis TaxID=943816 RepID=A0A1H9SXQ6_9ACTN|nr:hypothetical protein SAMN05421870_105186 [Streptomyces qinglanensis]